jgi:hypothetical protein
VIWTAAGCSLVAPLDGLTGSGDADAAPTDGPSTAEGASEGAAPDATHDGGGGTDGPSTPDHVTPADSSPPDVTGDTTPPASTGYKRAIIMTAGDAVGAGYSVRFPLDTKSLVAAGKALASLADLRVVDSAGTARDRVVDAPNTTGSTVWFSLSKAIAAGASDTYWLEYGHPDAGAPPASGANVFAFYDDFSTAQIASHWIVEGTPTVAGGTLTLHAYTSPATTKPDALTTNAQNDGVPAASEVEIVASVPNPASPADPDAGFWYWLGYQHQGDFAPNEPWVLWIARDVSQLRAEEVTDDASFTSSVIGQDTASHDYVIARAPSQTVFTRDGTSQFTAGLPNGIDYSLMLRNWMPQSDVLVTLVRARALVDKEPTLALGAEQPGP